MSALRVIHGVINFPPVDVLINGKKIVYNLAYGQITAYQTIPNQDIQVEVVPSTDQPSKNNLTSFKLQKGGHYTLELLGSAGGNIQLLIKLTEQIMTCPQPGKATLRFVNDFAVEDINLTLKSGDKVLVSGVQFAQGYTLILSDLSPTTLTIVQDGGGGIVFSPFSFAPFSGGHFSLYALGGFDARGQVVTIPVLTPNQPQTTCECLEQDLKTQAYMGQWFQIASIPTPFESKCVRSVAQYTLLNDRIGVKNICYDQDWKVVDTILGSAVATNPCVPAALTVSFPGIPVSQNPNYLIHATDYEVYSVIGSSDRKTLFILSRTKQMTQKNYDRIVKFVASLGYDVSKIVVDFDAIKK